MALIGETPRTEAPLRISNTSITAIASDDPMDDIDDQLTFCVRNFEESEDTCRTSRALCERDGDYYYNDQLTQKEREILRKRGQPELIINYVQRKVNFALGFERRMRSDPKAFPRTPDEEQGAEAATDALRFVADQANWDDIRSDCYQDLHIYGTCGVDLVAEQYGEKIKILPKRIEWDRLFWDPHSRAKDFKDAKYKGIVVWMDRQDAVDKWPDAIDAIENTMTMASRSELFDDRPRYQMWTDNRRKRVRIVQIHYEWAGKWMVATFTRGGFVEEPAVSPYIDSDGNPVSSLDMRSMYVDKENNRFGPVRYFISLQDEINKRRSKALHLFNVRQTYGTKQAITDTQKAKIELAKPDGHVELNPGTQFGVDFGVLPTGDMAQGQVLLYQQSVAEMNMSGPNNALSGKGTEGQSGRAIQAQQQGGAVEMEPDVDALKQFTRQVYDGFWLRIRQFWTSEMWIRVTDDERNLKWVGLNKKITLRDKLKEIAEQQGKEVAAQVAQDQGVQSPMDPKLNEVVEIQNEISGLDVDIVIEEGPDISTLQSEQFDTLAQLAGQSGGQIPFKALVQASSLRNKDQILDEMEKGVQLPPQVQEKMQGMEEGLQEAAKEHQAAEQQIQELKMQLAQKDMEIASARADTGVKGAEIEVKNAELNIKAREVDLAEREMGLREAQAIAQIEAGQMVEGTEGAESAPTPAATVAQPQQIMITSPDSEAAAQGIQEVVGTIGVMAEAGNLNTQVILEAIQAGNAQSEQNIMQLAQVLAQVLSAPKTATLSNGKQVTVTTGVQ